MPSALATTMATGGLGAGGLGTGGLGAGGLGAGGLGTGGLGTGGQPCLLFQWPLIFMVMLSQFLIHFLLFSIMLISLCFFLNFLEPIRD